MRGRTLAVLVVLVALGGGITPARAAITLGQLGTPLAPNSCAGDRSWAQPTVTSGNTYASPVNGTITSWTVNHGLGVTQVRLKVWRVISGNLLASAATSDLETKNVGTVTFPSSLPIAAGESIGLQSVGGADCVFSVPGESYLWLDSGVPDGVSANFGGGSGYRLSVTATVEPTTGMTLGGISRDKARGTATLTVQVPNPGSLVAAGGGATGQATATAAGPAKLKIKAKGKRKSRLNRSGKVTVNPTITYTPTGGSAISLPAKMKLKKD